MGTDVASAAGADDPIQGSSLWSDAWKRVRRNRAAVASLAVVAAMVAASLLGPPLIELSTGYTYDLIPADRGLVQSFAPFRGPGGSWSASTPCGPC